MRNSMSNDPEHIAISKSKGIHIDWRDGVHCHLPLALLRDECPCASCTGSHGTTPQKTNHSAQANDASPFKMFQPTLRMVDVESVGSYALRIVWSDGHQTGIYTWEHLRQLCDRLAAPAAPIV
jgi:DUF971 family protein